MTNQSRSDESVPQGWQAPDSSYGYAPQASQSSSAAPSSPYVAADSAAQWQDPTGVTNGQYPPPQQTPSTEGMAGTTYSAPYDQESDTQQAGATGYQAQASWAPAPQPGIIPLRPLNIGDLFDGTFRAIRSNPTVMFGFAVAVMAVLSLVTALMTWYSAGSMFAYLEDPAAMQGDDLEGVAAFLSSTLLTGLGSTVLNSLAIMILSGMLALTVTDAVLGHLTSIEHAWERIRPRVWKLLGLSILVGLISTLVAVVVFALFGALAFALYTSTESVGLVVALVFFIGLPTFLIAAFFVQVKLLFAPVVLAVEGQSVGASLKRSLSLTQGSFWRVLGRLLLITMVTSFIAGFLGGLAGLFQAVLPLLVSQALALAISNFLTGILTAFLIPISSAFHTLMYIDERIRKENLAPSLIQASQVH